MGANVSVTEIVNRTIQEQKSRITCRNQLTLHQSLDNTFNGNLVLRKNCRMNLSNVATLKSNCDMSAVYDAIARTESSSKTNQTAAAGLAVNTNVAKTENTQRLISRLKSECGDTHSATQIVRNNFNGSVVCDDDAVINAGNEIGLEAACLLTVASKIDSENKATTESTQKVESILGPIMAALFGPLILIGGLVLLVVLVPGLLGAAKSLSRTEPPPSATERRLGETSSYTPATSFAEYSSSGGSPPSFATKAVSSLANVAKARFNLGSKLKSS